MSTAHIRKSRSATAPIVAARESESAKVPTPKVEPTNGSTGRVTELERLLSAALKERDDLARDVEALCMQSSSSIFDSSMVLSERIFALERDLSTTKAQLAAVTEERNNLREDLRGHKDSKRTVDNSWRVERERAEKLEKELQFYQTQSARAMADRDQASWEAEELKRSVLDMEARLRQAESLAETAATEQKELETQLAEAKGRIKDLEFKARECETIPGLWKHISENTTQIKSMEVVQVALERNLSLAKNEAHEAKETLSGAQQKLAGAEQELEETRSKAHAESREAATRIKELKGRVNELEEAVASLEHRVEEAEGSSAAAQANAETVTSDCRRQLWEIRAEHSERTSKGEAAHKAEIEPLRKEAERLKSELKAMTSEFNQARGEKVQALMRVSQAEQTAEQAFQETGGMLDQVHDLKDKVVQATQEKVAALMQVASLKEQLRVCQRGGIPGSSGNATSPAPQNWTSGWKLWGAGGGTTEAGDAESQPNGANEGRSMPQDLREAISQLRGLQERIAELDTLADSVQGFRQRSEELQQALADTPTHLRKKEIGKKVAALASEVGRLEEKHGTALSLHSGGTGTNAAESPVEKKSPDKGSPVGKKGAAGDDSAAAAELLLTLRMVVESLRHQSGC